MSRILKIVQWKASAGRPARGLLLACTLVSCAFSPSLPYQLAAQTAETQISVPVLKLNARTVLIDIVVTGKHGKPVTGLHKNDFEVSEEGTPQSITSFEEHGGTQSKEDDASPSPAKSDPNVFTNVPHVMSIGSPLILLLDSLNTPEADQSRVRGVMLKYLQNLPPGRPIAIFTMGTELHCIQGFTGDLSTSTAVAKDAQNGLRVEASPLLASKDQENADNTAVAHMVQQGYGTAFGSITHNVDVFQQTQATLLEADRVLTTLEAFRRLAHYLSGIPGRKSVAWFSGAFPHLDFTNSANDEAFKEQRDYSEEAKATEAALSAARVAIYPISPAGLTTNAFYGSDTQLPVAGLAADGKVRNDFQASMDALAQATGGEAIYSTNDLDGALSRVADDGSHYYTLFYVPARAAAETQYRKIVVKVSNRHYKVAYNHGYYVKEKLAAQTPATNSGDDPLGPYLQPEALDSTQILFDLRVVPVAASDSKAVLQANGGHGSGCSGDKQTLEHPFTCYSVRFDVGASSLQFDNAQDGSYQDSLELMLLVSDKTGKTLNGIKSKVKLHLDAARYAYILAHGAHFGLEIGVPKDGVSLRGGLYDQDSGSAGTLRVSLASIGERPTPNLSKVALDADAAPGQTASEKRAQPESLDPLADPAGSIDVKEEAAPLQLPHASTEPTPPVPEIITGGSNPSIAFWTVSPSEVKKMLTSAPEGNAERYALLRAYFTKFGCTGTHLSEDRSHNRSGQNLICMLPGSDTRTIVVTAHYEHQKNDSVGAQSWDSAIELARLYKALQTQQRHYSFVFVELGNEGEKQLLDSLASADLPSLVAVVALDLRGPGQVDYRLSQAEPYSSMQGLATDDEILRGRAIRKGEETKAVLSSTLIRSAQVNKFGKPVELQLSRAAGDWQLFRRSTYIPSILIYSTPKSQDAVNVGKTYEESTVFDVLGTYLCSLDANLVRHAAGRTDLNH